MQDILRKVKDYIDKNHLLSDKAKVIIGVSGGSDSMALLDILNKLGYECIVAHCNFHLRGQESYRDEFFVERVAKKYNVEYTSVSFNTKKHIQEESISLEMAARELRYAWFEKIKKKYNAERIAVAHHLNDSVETVLINLIRGTGIRGLTGISPINGNIIRPLLCIYREDISTYLTEQKIDFVEDSTNKEDLYIRNKIRLKVLPLLQSINPSVISSISRTSENLSQTESIYNNYIENVKSEIFFDNKIDINRLKQEINPKTILFEILHPFGFNTSTIDNAFDSINGISGKRFYSDDYLLIKDREYLILQKKQDSTDNLFLIDETQKLLHTPIDLTFEYLNKLDNVLFDKNPDILYLDKAKVSFPLTLRKWKIGDKFKPFGMKGHKKLSDYFSDKKFSLQQKENTWILCSNNEIIWIVGERADDRFKITDTTTEVLKINFNR